MEPRLPEELPRDDAHGEACCFACGEPLPAASDFVSVEQPLALLECPACGADQVVDAEGGLCDGERLALRHALEYLRERPPG